MSSRLSETLESLTYLNHVAECPDVDAEGLYRQSVETCLAEIALSLAVIADSIGGKDE